MEFQGDSLGLPPAPATIAKGERKLAGREISSWSTLRQVSIESTAPTQSVVTTANPVTNPTNDLTIANYLSTTKLPHRRRMIEAT